MEIEQILLENEKECNNTIDNYSKELKKVRTGRASSGIIENILVDYYGNKTQLFHLGQISVPESRVINIQVYDESACVPIEKAILNSNLGLNPSRAGNSIRITIPMLNEQTRKEIVKNLHKAAEDVRVSIRNHRRSHMEEIKNLEKDGLFSKDDSKRYQEKLQKQIDEFIKEIDKMLAVKEAECMEV